MTQYIHYHDENNYVPYALLEWNGPGWYEATVSGKETIMSRIGTIKSHYPLPSIGASSAKWADAPEEAAGNYAEFKVMA